MPSTPAAMRQLAELRTQLQRIERVRVRLIDGQPVSAGDLLLLVDRARDANRCRDAPGQGAGCSAGGWPE